MSIELTHSAVLCFCGHEQHGICTMTCLEPGCPCMIRNSDPGRWRQLNGTDEDKAAS